MNSNRSTAKKAMTPTKAATHSGFIDTLSKQPILIMVAFVVVGLVIMVIILVLRTRRLEDHTRGLREDLRSMPNDSEIASLIQQEVALQNEVLQQQQHQQQQKQRPKRVHFVEKVNIPSESDRVVELDEEHELTGEVDGDVNTDVDNDVNGESEDSLNDTEEPIIELNNPLVPDGAEIELARSISLTIPMQSSPDDPKFKQIDEDKELNVVLPPIG